MKKFTISALFVAALCITACHYGQNEAKDTLERNEKYKTENADYSVNRAGDGGKMNETVATESTPVDTTVKAATPAAETTHESN